MILRLSLAHFECVIKWRQDFGCNLACDWMMMSMRRLICFEWMSLAVCWFEYYCCTIHVYTNILVFFMHMPHECYCSFWIQLVKSAMRVVSMCVRDRNDCSNKESWF